MYSGIGITLNQTDIRGYSVYSYSRIRSIERTLSSPSFSPSTYTEPLCALGWLTLVKRRLFHRCVFFFKYLTENGLTDFNFETKRICDIQSYNTRANPDVIHR